MEGCGPGPPIADICHTTATTRDDVLFQDGVFFFVKRAQNFGLFWPIWSSLLQIYTLFGVLLQAEK